MGVEEKGRRRGDVLEVPAAAAGEMRNEKDSGMTPVNATTQMVDDDTPAREPAAPKMVRPSAEAIELAWMLRGASADAPIAVAEDEDDAAILQAVDNATQPVEPHPVAAPGHNSQNAALPEPDGLKRDWSSALDLVQEACEAIRISEERVQELERLNQQSAAQSREDIKALQLQLQVTERRAQHAEARASKAEARAVEAESWLTRLHDAVVTGFGSRGQKTDDY